MLLPGDYRFYRSIYSSKEQSMWKADLHLEFTRIQSWHQLTKLETTFMPFQNSLMRNQKKAVSRNYSTHLYFQKSNGVLNLQI